jgi:alkylation response protein AidB-like acyl-CoA dehydrogenase
MDFDDTPEGARFRDEVRTFLRQHSKPRAHGATASAFQSETGTPAEVASARAWQRVKFEAGYAAITWPKEFGGRDGRAIQQVIYHQEESKFDVPSSAIFFITLGICVPALLAYAKQEQKAYYTLRAMRGEHIWCQLFSEPNAGSDLAGLHMRAQRQGDDWLITGQKIWTSGAHYADFGVLLARSDPTVAKHKGLCCFFLDMKSPGIEIRPIKQMDGGMNFNEVYFTDVKIPDSQRLGEVGHGWEVALTTLMNERLSLGTNTDTNNGTEAFLELARSVELESGPALGNQTVRERIADWYLKSEGVRLTGYRTLTALSRGQVPGPESSISKAVMGPAGQEMMAFAMDLQEMGGVIRDPRYSPMGARWQEYWLFAPCLRVAGGTDEILRNVIAERVLGMPGDVRVDKDRPFKHLAGGRQQPPAQGQDLS